MVPSEGNDTSHCIDKSSEMKGVKRPAFAGRSWSVGDVRCRRVAARQPEEQEVGGRGGAAQRGAV